MKTIGTITYYKSLNYGAYLQCLALQEALKTNNYNSSVISYETPADIARYKLFSIKSPKSIAKSILFLIPNSIRRERFKNAQKQFLTISPNQKLDIAITGSDQVWNAKLSGNRIDPFFTLEKIEANKKISYAASIGNETYVKKYKNDFEKLVARLDHISVREKQAKEALSKITQKPITVVSDPTALLTKKQWEEKIKHIKKDSHDYIFSYFINIRKDQARALSKICKKLNLKTTCYSKMPKEKNIYKYCYADGPLQFLARLRDSKIVITSSFHGTIFSILFHKNFYVLMPEKEKRSRMDNILKITGLTERIIETEADLAKINLDDINYVEPQKKLDALRKHSLDWLRNAIEN